MELLNENIDEYEKKYIESLSYSLCYLTKLFHPELSLDYQIETLRRHGLTSKLIVDIVEHITKLERRYYELKRRYREVKRYVFEKSPSVKDFVKAYLDGKISLKIFVEILHDVYEQFENEDVDENRFNVFLKIILMDYYPDILTQLKPELKDKIRELRILKNELFKLEMDIKTLTNFIELRYVTHETISKRFQN